MHRILTNRSLLYCQNSSQKPMEDYESIIREYQNNTNATSPDPYLAGLLHDFGSYLCDKYDSTGEISHLQKAIEIVSEAFEETPQNDESWFERLYSLGAILFRKYELTRTLEDLDKMISLFQGSIDIVTPDDSFYTLIISLFEILLYVRFSETGDVADIDGGICIIRRIIDKTPPNHSDQLIFLFMLANWLNDRFDCVGEMPDLEEAICLGQDVINATPLNHPERAICLIYLAKSFRDRYSSSRDIVDINEAVSLAREACDIAPSEYLVQCRLQCGRYLCHRFVHDIEDIYNGVEEMADLEEAVYMAFETVELCPIDNEDWNIALYDLGCTLASRYVSTTTLADANSSTCIMMVREIIEILQMDDPLRSQLLCTLGACLTLRHKHTGAAADLDEAICAYQDALHTALLDDKAQLRETINLAGRLSTRHSCVGALSDIEEAILLTQMAIESIPRDHPQRVRLLHDLGGYHCHRYEHTGNVIDLDEAIRIGQYGLDLIPEGRHAIRCPHLNNLAIFFSQKYHCTGAISDIDESIILMREAIACASPGSTDRSSFLSGLGSSLLEKYIRTNAIEDLNEAIGVYQEVLEATPSNYHERAVRLHNFAALLSFRFGQSGEIADLVEAIRMSQEALSITPPSDLARASLLNGLGRHFLEKFCHTGTKVDLEEAIRTCQHAVDTIPQTHPGRALHLTNLGRSLSKRVTLAKDTKDCMGDLLALPLADNIIFALREYSLEVLPTGLKVLPTSLKGFLDTYYLLTEAEILADIEKAQECFIDALYHGIAIVKARFLAGRGALKLPYFTNYQKAYDVARHTIDLIPLLASRSLQNSDKQSMLFMAVGTSSDAAAIALHALPANQGPLAAIECLETGRGLIGSALFEQYEISTLKQHNPDLADSLLALQDRLYKPAIRDLSSATYSAAVDIETEENKQREVEQEYSDLLETVRLENGFQRFLLPPSETDMLHAAACGGPIVILNTSHHRCDALIIRQSGLEELALPSLLSESLIDEHSKDLESIETLAWLWENIVCPVLDALGFTGPPSDGIWPHVWWIPTGKLTKFPLHAAGHHLRCSGETTLDRVISSYATSIKAIIHTRRRGGPKAIESLNLVAIAMEDTEGHTSLVHARREVEVIVDVLESKNMRCDQPQQYKGSVLSAMSNCQIFHFAGHGEAHPTDPLQSSLLLKDWQHDPLTVASLLETNLSSNPPFLAYLSACGTGQTLNDDSIDESIHLTNAFQLAGFRHVIGTLWSVDDETCVDIAKIMYSSFIGDLCDDVVSRGLHDAVRTLRDRWVNMADGTVEGESRAIDGLREGRHAQLEDCEELGRPFWIPYVHFGV